MHCFFFCVGVVCFVFLSLSHCTFQLINGHEPALPPYWNPVKKNSFACASLHAVNENRFTIRHRLVLKQTKTNARTPRTLRTRTYTCLRRDKKTLRFSRIRYVTVRTRYVYSDNQYCTVHYHRTRVLLFGLSRTCVESTYPPKSYQPAREWKTGTEGALYASMYWHVRNFSYTTSIFSKQQIYIENVNTNSRPRGFGFVCARYLAHSNFPQYICISKSEPSSYPAHSS